MKGIVGFWIFLYLLLLPQYALQAQYAAEADSPIALLPHVEKSEKTDILIAIASTSKNTDKKTALNYITQAEDLSHQIHYTEGMILSRLKRAENYMYQSETDMVITHALLALDLTAEQWLIFIFP